MLFGIIKLIKKRELGEVENVAIQLESKFKSSTSFSECDINQLLESQPLLTFLMKYWKIFCIQFDATRHKIVSFDEENPMQMSISLIGTLWSSDITVG